MAVATKKHINLSRKCHGKDVSESSSELGSAPCFHSFNKTLKSASFGSSSSPHLAIPVDSSEVPAYILYLKELKPNEIRNPAKESRKKQICKRRIGTRWWAWMAFDRLSSLNLIGRSYTEEERGVFADYRPSSLVEICLERCGV